MVKRAGFYRPRSRAEIEVEEKHTAQACRLNEEQEQALLTEHMMHPPLTINQKLSCKMGIHGTGAREMRHWYAGQTYVSSYKLGFFCVRCGKQWNEGR